MSKSLIKKSLNLFKKSKILCIGDIMLDEFVYGDVNRMSPEAPVPVLLVKKRIFQLGGTGNVAKNISSLGGNVGILSVLGSDYYSNQFIKMIKSDKKIKSYLIKCTNYQLPVKTRFLNKNNQLLRVDKEDIKLKIKDLEKIFLKKFLLVLKNYNLVVISDYNKGLLSKSLLKKIIKICKFNDKKVLIDPKKEDFSAYTNADIITPNSKELSLAAGFSIKGNKDFESQAKKFLNDFNFSNLLITRSEDGMMLVSKDKVMNFSTKAKRIYDVTGAGDTVIGTIALGESVNLDISESIKLANFAAGIVVGKNGTAVATVNDMLKL